MKSIQFLIIAAVCGTFILMNISACTPAREQGRTFTKNTSAEKGYRDTGKESNRKKDTFDEEYRDFDSDDEDINVRSGSPDSKNEDRYSGDKDDNENSDHSYKKEKFYETGVASWYGREFHGKVTASGERFNMYEMTAAHKSLPFGTEIEVKNLDNGKSAVVTINDRGPYRDNRIIDLSYSAGKKIGILSKGETSVGIKILKKGSAAANGDRRRYSRDEDEIEPVVNEHDGKRNLRNNRRYHDDGNEKSTVIILQAGAFYSRKNAENLKKKIEEMTENTVSVFRDDYLYKVRIEGFSSKTDAGRLKKILSRDNISSFIVDNKE